MTTEPAPTPEPVWDRLKRELTPEEYAQYEDVSFAIVQALVTLDLARQRREAAANTPTIPTERKAS